MWSCSKLVALVVLGALIGFSFGIVLLFLPGLIWGVHR